MADAHFDKCVFINCPLDEEYEPILQAVLFCIIYSGFSPRLSTERNDSGENRLSKIRSLIENSKYSIHDLSRCKAKSVGEYYRMNMPFELGIDYSYRHYSRAGRSKKILILAEEKYEYQKALSDIAGFDIKAHEGEYQNAVRKVRNWLSSESGIKLEGAARILAAYADFQQWHYEEQLRLGFEEDDIQDYPTKELLDAMTKWVALGKPV
ncbi:MAG: hypothetical protein RIC29_04925 [Rhodospirillaceae bacterium]